MYCYLFGVTTVTSFQEIQNQFHGKVLGLRITKEQELTPPESGSKLFKHLQCVFDYDTDDYQDVWTVS